jgi:hypothetical protein
MVSGIPRRDGKKGSGEEIRDLEDGIEGSEEERGERNEKSSVEGASI